ncbi:MAG: glycosyltransferase family 4 protein [Coleofasciculus sp. S288]|nr:glycosyltransferase family 4 protein [Coleofasciculus sp. S288]
MHLAFLNQPLLNEAVQLMTRHYSSVPAPPTKFGLFRTPQAAKQVGIIAPHYGLERVSYMLPVKDYQFVRLKQLPLHRFERSGTFWHYTPIVLDRSVPLIHTFNMLPFNGERFIVSFEAELPRYLEQRREWQYRIGYGIMSSKRCAALLALSEVACRLAKQQMHEAGFPEIAAKISVFRGAVPLGEPSAHPIPKPATQSLKLLFVGADGFRKGLVPLVEAIEELRRGGVNIELTVISSVTQSSYVFGTVTPSAEALRQKLSELPWIDYYPAMSNAQVRQHMRNHELFVLPSLDESLGWSAIEAGMEGLASIVTNAFALPELVEDGKTGRLIPIDLNEQQRWRGLFLKGSCKDEAILEANQAIKQGLIDALQQVASNRSLMEKWGQAAREKMYRMYHPVKAAEALQQIYDSALH